MENLENKLSKKQFRAFEELDFLERNAVIALIISSSIREASRKYKAMTGRSVSDFWNNVYPGVKDHWKLYSSQINELAIMRLRAGTLEAVDELLAEINHYDVEIRHKASKYILDRALPENSSQNLGNTNKFQAIRFNFDKYIK